MRLALLAVAAVVLALPARGTAATFCVGTDPGCSGTQKGSDLAGAFDDAASTPGQDRIQIAAGTFKLPSGGVSYASSDAVEVVGAGMGKTTILAPDGTTLSLGGLGGAASTVRDLTIVAPPGGYAIQTPGRVQGVEVIRIEGAPLGGVLLQGAGSFVKGRVAIGEGWSIVTSGDANRVADAELRSGGGVLARGGRVMVERVSIPTTLLGLYAEAATIVARDVLISVSGLRAALSAQTTSAGDALVDASQVTLLGTATTRAMRVVSTFNGRLAEVNVRNAIIRGFADRVVSSAENGGRASSSLEWFLEPGVDPLFVDPGIGNYRLKAKSPAVDAGAPGGLEPGESATDLDGQPRIAGGRRDLGAYEYQPPDTKAPAVRIGPPTTVKMSKSGLVRLRLSCPVDERSCAGSLTLRRGSLVLGRARFQLGTAQTRVVPLRLTLRGRRLVLKTGRLRVDATVTASDAAGNRGSSRRTITLLRT